MINQSFPPHHQKNIKSLLYDVNYATNFHAKSYMELLKLHSVEDVTPNELDNKTFETVEAYRTLIDTINSYTRYLTKNNLQKYISDK